jgi:N-formylglutamate amidohydrolase
VTAIYSFTPGDTPLLISVPHAGTFIPGDIAARMTPEALALPDTDWHVEKLYDFAPDMGAGLIVATHSRYVVDLNRDPSGKPLYPGADNSELVPLSTFASQPIYVAGQESDPAEIELRRVAYWEPYHARIAAELDRLHARFGVALLWDGHSIMSRVPRFFDGRLPDFNLGSVRGKSAAPALIAAAMEVLERADGFSSVLDGRFTGGYITRNYGRPDQGRHALQLEMAESAYLDERAPAGFDPARAAPLKSVLMRAVARLIDWSATAPGAE